MATVVRYPCAMKPKDSLLISAKSKQSGSSHIIIIYYENSMGLRHILDPKFYIPCLKALLFFQGVAFFRALLFQGVAYCLQVFLLPSVLDLSPRWAIPVGCMTLNPSIIDIPSIAVDQRG
jgi:hypothetical protein